jgi:leucyl aminopeptidase (aminopeptidase T)
MSDADADVDTEPGDGDGDGELRGAAETAVRQCMGVGAEESCLVVTDDRRRPIGEALYAAALEVTEDAAVIRYPPGEQHGAEPPDTVAVAMREADAVLCPTTKSLSHTRARTRANEADARVATLPGITEEVFVTGLRADYESIAADCERIYEQVAGAEEIRVTAPAGTDITVEPGGRPWLQDTGIVHEPGEMSNLPAGETFLSPATGDGRVVVDGTMMPHGRLDGTTVAFTVEDGRVVEMEDPAIADQLATAAEEAGDAAYNLAELGIGANTAVTELVGSVLLDEKAAGTVHLAIGDDAGIGGDTEAPVHLDGIVTEPTVYADGEEITLPE